MSNNNNRFDLNFPEMQTQHDYLYFLFDNFDSINASTDSVKVKNLLTEIEHYLMFHFSCEEHLMRLYQFPSFAVHQTDHERVETKLVQFLDDYDNGNLNPKAMQIFFTGWLMEHSSISDSEYVRWIEEKRSQWGIRGKSDA